jgi:hypothetical protein
MLVIAIDHSFLPSPSVWSALVRVSRTPAAAFCTLLQELVVRTAEEKRCVGRGCSTSGVGRMSVPFSRQAFCI